jgi:nuclear pore complex protein Nup205
MSDLRPLEALQALHGELLAVCQHRFEGLQTLELLLEENARAFKKFLDKKSRNQQSRTVVASRRMALSFRRGLKTGEKMVVC